MVQDVSDSFVNKVYNSDSTENRPHPGEQGQAAPQGAAVPQHGHHDEEAAHGDDDGVHGRGVGEDGRLLQPGDTETALAFTL